MEKTLITLVGRDALLPDTDRVVVFRGSQVIDYGATEVYVTDSGQVIVREALKGITVYHDFRSFKLSTRLPVEKIAAVEFTVRVCGATKHTIAISFLQQITRFVRLTLALLLILAGASVVEAQTIRTHIHKGAMFGSDAYGAALWPQELDGNPRTREALIVRMDEKTESLEYRPVGLCPNGQVRRGQWMEPFGIGASKLTDDWLLVGWIARAGDRDVYTVQGIANYVEITFDLPPCS